MCNSASGFDAYASPGMTEIDFRGKNSPRAALGAALGQRRRRRMHGHVPDLLGIFADGTVGGEPRHTRDVEDAGTRPGRNYLPARVDAALRLVIGTEIGADHVVVEIAQRMRDGFEPAGLAGRELTGA